MPWLAENWPVLAALMGFFVALGEARVRVMDLRERVKALELTQAVALEELKLDVREIKTVLKLLRDRDAN